LAERYIHRCGIAAFQTLLTSRLAQSQGQEACLWLASLVRLELDHPGAPDDGLASADPWAGPGIQLEPVVLEPVVGEQPRQAAAALLDPTWLDDLAREQQALATVISQVQATASAPEAIPGAAAPADADTDTDTDTDTDSSPVPATAEVPQPEALIPRLKAGWPPAAAARSRPAPAPASLARLRSWLHDDALPEAS
jgi:hypothetical protein